MSSLIDNLITGGWLKSKNIIEAFRTIKREDFLPEETKNLAELNEALPIGFGQTISQPLVVAFMLELLQPEQGEMILDIGAGSGWTTALLAYIVSRPPSSQVQKPERGKGKVIAIEIIPELAEFGKGNAAKYDFIKTESVKYICGDGRKGYPHISSHPELKQGFDKILASAAIYPSQEKSSRNKDEMIPLPWKEQLKIGGRLVVPIEHSICLFEKKSETELKRTDYPGFVFVPLVSC